MNLPSTWVQTSIHRPDRSVLSSPAIPLNSEKQPAERRQAWDEAAMIPPAF